MQGDDGPEQSLFIRATTNFLFIQKRVGSSTGPRLVPVHHVLVMSAAAPGLCSVAATYTKKSKYVSLFGMSS